MNKIYCAIAFSFALMTTFVIIPLIQGIPTGTLYPAFGTVFSAIMISSTIMAEINWRKIKKLIPELKKKREENHVREMLIYFSIEEEHMNRHLDRYYFYLFFGMIEHSENINVARMFLGEGKKAPIKS